MLEGLGGGYVFYLFYADEQKVYYSLPMRLQRSFSLLEFIKWIWERTEDLCRKNIFSYWKVDSADCKFLLFMI